ncbi:hypothetical protein [Chlorobium phaeobacteroides]|uniref:hypothetical protein n=1 Tax=Chlorobium phaeobacteroides TaxID=1096 RepID=UPI0002FDE527|nr:hypothetical protein [Chlorobium phaeobacteroides]
MQGKEQKRREISPDGRDDKRGGEGLTRKEAQYHNLTNSSLNPKTRLDVGSANAETINSLNSFRENSCNSRATLPLHPNSILIKKPAVVFIGKARENQLPISFRANSCNSWATLPLHPNSILIEKPAVVFIGEA